MKNRQTYMSENEMTVPDTNSFLLPCLQILSDGKQWRTKEHAENVAELLNLTDEQMTPRSKNGTPLWRHKLAWARMHLTNAGLITRLSRDCFLITELGQMLLAKKPDTISVRFLRDTYPSLVQWLSDKAVKAAQTRKHGDKDNGSISELISEEPPEVILEQAHSILRADLARELLDQVKVAHWRFFERLVVDLLTKMGYGGSRQDAARVVGKSGDNGIDGVIKEDKLGLDVVYIQAKRYSEPVTISQVRDFAGALLYKKARKGVFITTSSFPKSAEDFVATIEQKIILIDGQRLAELMIEYNVGVAVKEIYEVKRIDYDYFDESEL